MTGPISEANGWLLVENFVSNSYSVGALSLNSTLTAGNLLGKATFALPMTAMNGAVLSVVNADIGATYSPDISVNYSKFYLGSSAQFNGVVPDSNVVLSMERGIADMTPGGRKSITAADALDALKLSVGITASTGSGWKELIAGDINHDGRVTAADALEILKVSVGVNTIQPSWVFVPNDASINPNLGTMTKTTVTYKDDFNLSSITAPTSATIPGILVGDVNNSWVIPT